MALSVVNFPAVPECGGKQWSVVDQDELAELTATVLIGRAQHAERILRGAQRHVVPVPDALREQLRSQLLTAPGPATWHRDGLLFEIMSWIVARITAQPNDIISTPHLKSTQQGPDTIKINYDENTRHLVRAVVFEQKCTEHPRNQFRDGMLSAFQDWKSGKRDNELVQAVTILLERLHLADEEHIRIYDRLVQERPLAFQAALTVSPSPYDTERCVALFAGYTEITPDVQDRLGDTFPLADIRAWFAGFAQRVWQKIEAGHV